MDTFNKTSRYILIFLVLVSLLAGLGFIFMPLESLMLWGLAPINPDLFQGAMQFTPSYGLYELGWAVLGIYALKNGSVTALKAFVYFGLTVLITGLAFGILALIQGMAVEYWLVIDIVFVIIYFYLLFINK